MFDPDERIAVTLQAQEWKLTIALLAKRPYEEVAGLIHSIQAQAAQQQRLQEAPTGPQLVRDDAS